ncbi:DUF7684 family protein [Sphingosinicella rhizophila]|uniref:DUF7684 domain-containing protein n=1 Tax=Sphingosinicella rhizophila TaxID=3050082 RepID=A0ABU3Q9Z5_9SPHN|nr:hypothetical protein [Sphingosinicella sp. GR2756]MDT9600231.1 hypothetical protein [Sphingosinicella sp. GR2756]
MKPDIAIAAGNILRKLYFMGLTYLHLSPDQHPPELRCGAFRALIISEVEVAQEWRNRIAHWLLKSGCLYLVAWGVECENWHDTVDWTNLEEFDFGDIPDDRFVMTTWHAGEPLSEAMWFAGQNAFHPHIELGDTVIVHVATEAKEVEIVAAYASSQTLPPEDG